MPTRPKVRPLPLTCKRIAAERERSAEDRGGCGAQIEALRAAEGCVAGQVDDLNALNCVVAVIDDDAFAARRCRRR